jgi:hypothetical protein
MNQTGFGKAARVPKAPVPSHQALTVQERGDVSFRETEDAASEAMLTGVPHGTVHAPLLDGSVGWNNERPVPYVARERERERERDPGQLPSPPSPSIPTPELGRTSVFAFVQPLPSQLNLQVLNKCRYALIAVVRQDGTDALQLDFWAGSAGSAGRTLESAGRNSLRQEIRRGAARFRVTVPRRISSWPGSSCGEG